MCTMYAQGRHVCIVYAQRVCASSMYSVCLCAFYLAHNECSVSLSAGGFIMMMSFPSFPDVESETQNFENLSKALEPNSGRVKARIPFA